MHSLQSLDQSRESGKQVKKPVLPDCRFQTLSSTHHLWGREIKDPTLEKEPQMLPQTSQSHYYPNHTPTSKFTTIPQHQNQPSFSPLLPKIPIPSINDVGLDGAFRLDGDPLGGELLLHQALHLPSLQPPGGGSGSRKPQQSVWVLTTCGFFMSENTSNHRASLIFKP